MANSVNTPLITQQHSCRVRHHIDCNIMQHIWWYDIHMLLEFSVQCIEDGILLIPQGGLASPAVLCRRCHDYLQRHLNKIGVTISEPCPLCGDDSMNGRHLQICSKLKITQEMLLIFSLRTYLLYWEARQNIADWTKLNVG
ncbi:hypothetical protein CEXT_323931 [Caerostris extrusa]|uniref:Uncharacterized protein n=1 Tax=Caerostris extrusa TaxID=172846 RepID=A0AAV4P454_CAEEX|nr:hypothetical protein CEXT_323931 [Caerostris extrusa]